MPSVYPVPVQGVLNCGGNWDSNANYGLFYFNANNSSSNSNSNYGSRLNCQIQSKLKILAYKSWWHIPHPLVKIQRMKTASSRYRWYSNAAAG